MATGYDEDEAEYDPYDDAPEWTEEDEERYQARQHEEHRRKKVRRRQALSFAVLVLVVLGAGVVGAGVNQGWWEWPFGGEEQTADPGDRCTPAAGGVASPEDTRVTVLNATDTRGLAATIGSELTRRGYTVDGVGNAEEGSAVTAVEIRHGPRSEAQARSVAAHFRKVTLVDDDRTGTVVDLVIGPGYSRMNDAAAAAAAIAAAAPAGCAPTTPAPDPAPSATG